jgi:hypothetical protein
MINKSKVGPTKTKVKSPTLATTKGARIEGHPSNGAADGFTVATDGQGTQVIQKTAKIRIALDSKH